VRRVPAAVPGKILGKFVRGGGGGKLVGGKKKALRNGMLNTVFAIEGAVCALVGVLLVLFPDNLRDSACNRTVCSCSKTLFHLFLSFSWCLGR
jgi:hypothetical protein